MTSKNRIKIYVENGYYHVYNRGVEKRDIFIDDQDYRVFLHLLKFYLSPNQNAPHPLLEVADAMPVRPRTLAHLGSKLNLLAYCLMPNHFHLLINQSTIDAMTKLMRRLLTTYVMYFNRRYKRVGYLFQGRYKAALIDTNEYILYLSRYIHLNPVEFVTGTDLVSYAYSSYPYYLGLKHATWVHPELILNLLQEQTKEKYQNFVEGQKQDDREILGKLVFEE